MIRPNFEKWEQNAPEIREKSVEAKHKRTRERFQAMYMIGTEQYNASQWAEMTNRCVQNGTEMGTRLQRARSVSLGISP